MVALTPLGVFTSRTTWSKQSRNRRARATMPRQDLTGRLRHRVRVASQMDRFTLFPLLCFFLSRSSRSSSLFSVVTRVVLSSALLCIPRTCSSFSARSAAKSCAPNGLSLHRLHHPFSQPVYMNSHRCLAAALQQVRDLLEHSTVVLGLSEVLVMMHVLLGR
eukprot:2428023-Amphidinium_carterae.2